MTKDRKQTSRGWATGEPSGVPPAPQDPRYAPHVIPHSPPPYTYASQAGSPQHGAHPHVGSPAYPQHGSPVQGAAYPQHGSPAYAGAYPQHGSPAHAYAQHASSVQANSASQPAYPQHGSSAPAGYLQHGSSSHAASYAQHGSSSHAVGYSPHNSSMNPDAYPQQSSPGYADSASPHAAYPHDSAPLHAGYASAPSPPPPYAGAPASPPSADPSRAAGSPRATAEPRAARSRPIEQATAGVSQRVRFLRLTYVHLLLAIGAFAGLLRLLMTNPTLGAKVSAPLVKFALGGRWNWGVVLVAFMAVSWIAETWAGHARSRAVQYLGLAFYVVAEALIFVPLLAIVEWKTRAILARGGAEPHIVRDAGFVTLGIFTALTLSVFLSRKDFSFLRSGLVMASGAALSLIAMSLAFGFGLGLVFSVAMVLLAAGYVLYHTSHVLAHHDPRHHVAAALALFSSVALMFWYVIRIFLRARE